MKTGEYRQLRRRIAHARPITRVAIADLRHETMTIRHHRFGMSKAIWFLNTGIIATLFDRAGRERHWLKCPLCSWRSDPIRLGRRADVLRVIESYRKHLLEGGGND